MHSSCSDNNVDGFNKFTTLRVELSLVICTLEFNVAIHTLWRRRERETGPIIDQ